MSQPTEFPPPDITGWVHRATTPTCALVMELRAWADYFAATASHDERHDDGCRCFEPSSPQEG